MRMNLEVNKDLKIYLPLAGAVRRGSVQIAVDICKNPGEAPERISSEMFSDWLKRDEDRLKTSTGCVISRGNLNMDEEFFSCLIFRFDDRNHRIGLCDGAYADFKIHWLSHTIRTKVGMEDFCEAKINAEPTADPEEMQLLLKELERRDQTIGNLQQQLSEAHSKASDREEQWSVKSNELEGEKKRLEEMLALKETEFFGKPEHWEKVLEEFGGNLSAEIRQQAKLYGNRLEEATMLLTEKRAEVDERKEQVEHAEQDISTLEERITQLGGVLGASEVNRKNLEEQIAETEDRLKEQEADIQRLEELNTDNQEKIKNQCARLQQNQEVLQYLKDSNLNVKETMEHVEQELTDVEEVMSHAIRLKEEKAAAIEAKILNRESES